MIGDIKMTDKEIELKIEKLQEQLSYDTEGTLSCDSCLARKKYVWANDSLDCEVLHFSGFIDGKYNHHIHLCKDCINKNNIQLIDIKIKGKK